MRKIYLTRVLAVIVGLAMTIPAISPVSAQSNTWVLQQQRAQQAAANARRAQESARQAQMQQQRQQQMMQQQQRQQVLARQQELQRQQQIQQQQRRNNSAATSRRDSFNSAAGVTVRTRPGMGSPQPGANTTRSAPTTAIRGTPTRNVGANEGRGFVSSGGIAKLTRPMTAGDIKKGFTGKMTGDGRALVRFQGRVFAVPAGGVSGLVRRTASQNVQRSRWTVQQRQGMAARTQALAARKATRVGGTGAPRPSYGRRPANDNSKAAENAATNRTIIATDGGVGRGVSITPELLRLQGTSKLVGNFRGIRGLKVEEIISRVPKNWKIASQDRGMGIKFIDETGAERLRMHGPSATAPVGSNSAVGWTVRILVPGTKNSYYDDDGNIVGLRENAGHIPIYGNLNSGT